VIWGQVLETKALGNKISAWPEKIMKEKSYKPQAPSLTACPRDDRMNSNPLWTLDLSGGRSNGSGPVT